MQKTLATFKGERDNFDVSAHEAAALHSPTLPILIHSREFTDDSWNRKQEGLRMISTNSRRVVAERSGHYIQIDQPALFEE
jgi:hypothetical protein